MGDPIEFAISVLRIDGNEEFLSGFSLRGGRTARTGLVRVVASRSSGKKGCEKGWRAADQIVIRGEQFDGNLVLGGPPLVAPPNVADLQ